MSGVVALTLSPVMSSMLLDARQNEGRLARLVEHYMASLAERYRRALSRTLAARGAVLLVGVAVLAAIVVLLLGIRRELAPTEDQGAVIVIAKAPQYAGWAIPRATPPGSSRSSNPSPSSTAASCISAAPDAGRTRC